MGWEERLAAKVAAREERRLQVRIIHLAFGAWKVVGVAVQRSIQGDECNAW